MGAKVTFDATNRLVTVTQAPVDGQVTLDVEVDLYSDMKEDMIGDVALARNPPAFTQSQGGVTTPTGFTGKYFFLNNADGWVIQPYDADHELILTGNLFAVDADKPLFVSRTGRTILISREFSNLAQGWANDTLATDMLTHPMTETYPVDGQSAMTPTQALYATVQLLTEFQRSGTLISVKQRDGSTEAMELSLDSATAPTSSTQSA